MSQLRGAVIGAGYFARFQYEAWTRIPEVRIVASCDRIGSKTAEVIRNFGVPRAYTDWREMIDAERPDFVDIVTGPDTHEEMCSYAAQRGVHIICQKPLAPTYVEAAGIVAETSGVRFMVHENWRWQPWWREIRRLRDADAIGEFTHLHFRMRMGDGWGPDAYLARQPFFREYPRLLIYETGVHFIDTFRYLFGEIVEVFANLRRLNPAIRGEETGQIFFRFEKGATAILDANRYNESESPNPRYTFGDLRIDAMGGHVTMDSESEIRIKPLGQRSYVHDYTRRNVNFAGDCVYALQRHFTDCMLTGDPFESTGEDYLKTIRVVERVYESAAANQLVRV